MHPSSTSMRHAHLPFLLGVALLGFPACNSRQAESTVPARARPALVRTLRKVTGSSVNFDITTFISVRCAAFEHQFPHATPLLIEDSARLRAILQRLAVLQPDTQGGQLDTRAQAVFFYNDQTQDTLCMDQFTCTYRGQNLRADSTLYHLLGVGPNE